MKACGKHYMRLNDKEIYVERWKKAISAKGSEEASWRKWYLSWIFEDWGLGDGRGLFHTQRAQIARLRSQETWTWKSKQFSLARAWGALKGISKAPVVLGTYTRQLLRDGRVNQAFDTAGEAPSVAVALRKNAGRNF